MPSDELNDQLEYLFEDAEHQPEAEPADTDESLEETILDLLENRDATQPRSPEPTMVDAPPYRTPYVDESSITQVTETGRVLAETGIKDLTDQARKFSIIIRGTMIVVGVFLVLLLINLIWQWPALPSQISYVLYFGVGLAIVAAAILQWQGHVSLNKALHQAQAQASGEQPPLPPVLNGQIDQLVEANAQLQRRVFQLKAAAQVSHRIASTNDFDLLVQTAVDAITDCFDFHHTSLFLIDVGADEEPSEIVGRWATLRADSGEMGQRMLDQGHKIKVGHMSPVGWCAARGRPQTIPDPNNRLSRQDLDANIVLPDTRSELALPLKLQDRIIGVLDLHSSERQIFSQETIELFQGVADQVALAIDRTRVLPKREVEDEQDQEIEAERATSSVEEKVIPVSQRSLTVYERTRSDIGLTSSMIQQKVDQAIQQTLEKREIFAQVSDDDVAIMVSPITLRGEPIGVLGLSEKDKRHWTEQEIALIETITDQMALAIENASLLRDTQRRAERERLAADISAKVRSSTDVDSILRTAIRELGRVLRASEGMIKLGVEVEDEVIIEPEDKVELEKEEEGEELVETISSSHPSEQTNAPDPDPEVEREMTTETSAEKATSV